MYKCYKIIGSKCTSQKVFIFGSLLFSTLVCNQINLGNQHNNEVYIRLLNSWEKDMSVTEKTYKPIESFFFSTCFVLRDKSFFILICAVRLYDLSQIQSRRRTTESHWSRRMKMISRRLTPRLSPPRRCQLSLSIKFCWRRWRSRRSWRSFRRWRSSNQTWYDLYI